MLTQIELYRELGRLVSPLIKHYRTDLKHDKTWLLGNPGVPFLHFTSESSTHIVSLDAADSERWPTDGVLVPYLFSRADRWHILRQKRDAVEAINNSLRARVIYYWNGHNLQEVNAARALRIVSDYCTDVQVAWMKPQSKAQQRRDFELATFGLKAA